MPERSLHDPYDFSGAPVASYDFNGAPRVSDTVRPPINPAARFFLDYGLIDPDSVDPHGWRFFEEPASSTVTSGTRAPNIPAPAPTREKGVGDIFKEKMATAPGPARQMFGPVAAIGTAGEVTAGAVELMGQEYDPDASMLESSFGLVRNVGRSLANIGPGLLNLPEALVRDPGGTALAMLEFVPDQAVTLWKATMPATTAEERREKEAAWKALYEDPLGPAFAALMVGGFARAGARAASRYRQAAKAVKLSDEVATAINREKKQLDYESALEREAAGAEARATPAPPPNVPTRALTTSIEKPPAGPITDPSRLLPASTVPGEVVGPGMGFTARPKSRSGRIPESEAVRGEFGGAEFSETVFPSGREIRPFEGQVPKRSTGVPPPGNLMDILKVVGDEATKADVTAGRPPKPPRYQPFLRSGKFTEIKALDDAVPDQVPLMELANPILEIPDNIVLDQNLDTRGWLAKKWDKQKRIFDVVRQMETRVESAPSKALLSSLRDKVRFSHRNLGIMANELEGLGINLHREGLRIGLKRKFKGIQKMTAEEAMKVPAVRDFFVRVGEKAKAMGMQTVLDDGTIRGFELSEDFLRTGPYRMKHEIAREIWENISGTYQNASLLAKEAGHTGNTKWLSGVIDKAVAGSLERYSKVTREAITRLIDPQRGMFKTPGEAIAFLAKESSEQMFRRHGVERPRLSKMFPEEWRETNPATLFGRYINEMANAMAEIEVFGPGRRGLADMMENIKAYAPGEFSMMSDLSDVMMGVIDRTKPLSPTGALIQRQYGKYVYGAKVGLGFAPLVQVTQPLVSFVPDAGVVRSVKGALKAMNPEYRALLRAQGVIGPSAFHRLVGYGSEGFLRYMPTTRFFDWANRVLDYTAAATGEVYARDLYRLATKDTKGMIPLMEKRVNWARKTLNDRFGIDYTTPLGDAEFMRMTQDYARFTQLHPDATLEPRFFNLPQTRWMATLKRFVYRQTILSKRVIWDQMKQGNVFPFLRAAAGGLLGGDLIMAARNKIKDTISGKPGIRPEGEFITDDVLKGDFPWQEIANRYAVIGTLGMISDIGWMDEEDPVGQYRDAVRSLEFTLMPVGVSDVTRAAGAAVELGENVMKSVAGSEKEKRAMPMDETLRRAAEDAAGFLGTWGYSASSQFKSEPSELKANKQEYSNWLKRARQAYWNGEQDRAWKILKEWNDKNKYYPVPGLNGGQALQWMTFDDISDRRFMGQYKR